MFKKIMHGFMFGTGFSIALILFWLITINYILPTTFESAQKEPTFNNPKTVSIGSSKTESSISESRKFDFFKHSEYRMEIPKNGGVLSMSVMPTPPEYSRPNTYQLWMTETELWQIRTTEEKVEIEKLPYPKDASPRKLDSIMHEKLGVSTGQSSMSISEISINEIKYRGNTNRDSSLNGELKATIEGVIFIAPNKYE